MNISLKQALQKSNTLLKENNFEAALIICQSILKVQPTNSTAHHYLAISLQKLGQLEDAAKSYKKAIELKPNYPEAHSNFGKLLQDFGQLEDAEKSYKKAIELKPELAEANFNLANIQSLLDKFEDAKKSYQKAIELRPDHFTAHNNLGVILLNLGQLEDAVESFKKAIELKPDYHEPHNNKGIVLQKFGRLDEAELSYKKAIELKKDFTEAYYNFGKLLGSLGRYQEAEIAFKKVITLKPNFKEVHNHLGIIFLERNKHKESAEQFKLSDLKISKLFLLKCYFHLNEQSNFYNHLDYLIKLNEHNAVIGSLISRSKIKYKINKSNPFCNHPLKYALNKNIAKVCDFKNIFIKGATDILNNKLVKKRNQGLLINGQQTTGNLFSQKNINTNEIQKIIHLEIEKYRSFFKDSEEGFLKSWPNHYYLYGWLVSMKNGGKIRPHMHEYGWVSGSIYINVPPKLKIDSGNLVVCIEEDKNILDKTKDQKKSMDVITGSLCIFPSSLLHYTIPFESTENRIVLAFDIVPK